MLFSGAIGTPFADVERRVCMKTDFGPFAYNIPLDGAFEARIAAICALSPSSSRLISVTHGRQYSLV